MDHWQRVMAKVRSLPDPDDVTRPEPLLSLEDFFEGNDQVGSIAANLDPDADYAHPQYMYNVLRRLRNRSDVADVWVSISEVMEYDDPALTEEYRDWPYSNKIYIIASLSRDQVAGGYRPFSRMRSAKDSGPMSGPARRMYLKG